MFNARMKALRQRLADSGINVALITDDDSVYYYSGYYDYIFKFISGLFKVLLVLSIYHYVL